jgi:hypothetical protein
MAIAASSKQLAQETVSALGRKFKLKDLGELKRFLGLDITRDRAKKQLRISQVPYMRKILSKFEMLECKGVRTPMDQGLQLVPDEELFDLSTYQQAVGSLMYLTIMTRPDLAFSVNALAMFSSKPSPTHWQAVKRVLRYVKATENYGITLGGSHTGNITLVGYSDSSFADVHDGRSTGGYIFLVGQGPVSWSSRRQPIVALSTTEAEYIQATETAKESVWLKSLLQGFGVKIGAVQLFGDNRSSIALSKNDEFHARTKHINVKYHYIRSLIDAGEVQLSWIATDENLADITTKALSPVKLDPLVQALTLKKSVSSC